ncbi:oxidoreductase [Mesorhizobium sp. CAU 1741]|uniref:oxidoreductase n=1 Tax=Mesorhizobium sp. CAU 1741 TaxID=3140366 RepID=UPI00325B3CBB
MTTRWTLKDIPPQRGRNAVVTGTGGLGYEDALALALAGADVIIAGRNPHKGAEAVSRIRQSYSGARVDFEALDLGSLASIAAFAGRIATRRDRIDILINNAGVMAPPKRQETADGLELQFGTNYVGHFALTASLMPLMQRAASPRVVTLSSVAARQGRIDFDDLQSERNYQPMPVYSQSKLACLMFALELQRRSDAAHWGIESIAAHPGISRTDLLHNAPGRNSLQGLARTWLWFLFQPAARGALPTLYAATDPSVRAGGYYGPTGFGEVRGWPGEARVPEAALNADAARRLWNETETLTGLTFDDFATTRLLRAGS